MTNAAETSPVTKKPCVVLLHGLARTALSMSGLARHLSGAGFHTVNVNYPSTRKTISRIAEEHLHPVVVQCREKGWDKIHFVTHSMGGIVVRQYLQTRSLPAGSRVVMLSPPNKGSEVTDGLKGLFLYQWIMGPAGAELGTGPGSTPNRLGPIDMEVGIITGSKSLNPLFSDMIEGPDDGKVAVKNAKLPEMADFFVVESSHGFIMNNPDVKRQTACFLTHGKFE
ncbi:MAG: alpha/beta hydrolase [Desulfobacterales bacterium]|nr:alpha/beta hydrolase [Desulfobacterales bacterium]